MSATAEKRYPLSKEETSLYLACTMHPERKNAYVLGWCLELPTEDAEMARTTARLESATKALFAKHRILCARIGQDDSGALYKYDSGEAPVIEYETLSGDAPLPADARYCSGIDLAGGRLYRVVIARLPSMVKYYLIVHHIVMDGTGRQNLVRDFEAAFRGDAIGTADLAPYAFAVREREAEKSEAFEADRAYFTALLAEAEAQAPDPDRHEDGERFSHYACWFDRVDPGAVRQKKLASGVRTSTIFTAAVGYALALFTGAKQAVLGTAMAGRTPETENSCGVFVRTLPIRCGIAPDRSVDDYLRDLDGQTTLAREHSLYTYLDMNTECGLTLPVCFVYQGDTADDPMLFDGIRCRASLLRADESDYEILFYLWRKEGRYLFEAVYRSDHYSRAFLQTMAATAEQVLSELLIRQDMAEIQPAAPDQLERMDRWNDTARDVPDTDIVSLFREAAEKYPDHTAVLFRDRELTYRQVNDLSDRVAGHLREQGVGRDDVVSILIPRSETMVIAPLGVLKSGAAYQPLDPSYPAERLEFMMKDANCKLLIADEALLEKVPAYKGRVLLTRDIPNLPACGPMGENPKPEDLFILLYTSGSTGTPKGVMLEHRNLVNFCHWYRDYFELNETGRVAAYASFGFDACMMDLYPALTAGACVCIVEEEARLDLMAMEAWFNRLGITHSFMTTQVGRQFYTLTEPRTLRYLSVGGEKLVPVTPKAGNPALVNGYGPTECTVFSTVMPVNQPYDRVPIGKPLANYRCYVVDGQLRRLPPGAPGELLISGRGVARGYLNRPDLTQQAFIPNPFSAEPDHARAYRTGDVVRALPDGTLDFIGRNDGQVKVRGFRIELTEVEGVIREFPGIADATVQTFAEESTGEKYIAAYVVSDGPVDIPALNAFIRARKPPYMVPAVTMQIDAIPLNQNQKVNARALPKPERTRETDTAARSAAPLNVLEQELKAIVSEIVNVREFGITERFGDLGLTSISGIHLAVSLYKRYGVQLSARELVSEGSLQGVENRILEQLLQGGARSAEAQEAEAVKAPASCRLSFAQQGVYAECLAHPEAVNYNLPFDLTFPEGVAAEALREAVRKVVEAHPYILCRFVADRQGEIIQEPIPDFDLEIPVLALTEEAFAAHKQAFVRPFDLATGPLVRFEVVQTGALHLLADLHHLVADGASIDLLQRQLCQALDGAALPREAHTYYDYVAAEKIAPEAEAYFDERMAGVENATQLIPDVFEPLPHAERKVSVPTDFAGVKAFAQSAGVTPAAVYLAATYIAYSRYVCEDAVAIATISNGRGNLKFSDTMGMFVNTLPLAITLDNAETVSSFLGRVSEDFAAAIAHENYPFARVASKYDFRPMASYTYQIGVLNEYRVAQGEVEIRDLAVDIAKLPVGVYIEGDEHAARIEVAYDAAAYSEAMMRGLAESVEHALRGLMSCRTLAEISLTGQAQWRVLDGFNKPWDLDYDRTGTVVSVFRRNAKAQPDKTAAVYRDRAYTYRALDELTDRLAAKLYRRACEAAGKTDLAEEVVSILIPRDENVFILPLAAIKAGLAYEPLDPGYPKERLNFMVKDAGACLLLAEESLLPLVDEYHGATLTVRELYAMEDVPTLPAGPKPEDLFILLYTSGSTGTPKGCQIEHRNLVAYAHGVRNDFCTRNDRIGAYASFGFDVNMEDVFCTLLNGGTVCLIPEEARMDLGALAAYFDEAGVTALLLTTQVGVQFIQNYPRLKTLRLLIMGGEKLPAVDPAGLSYTIANGYGPTENCCGVSMFPIRTREPNIPIGRPFPTIHGYVLDKTGHRLPAGAAGEYCLSGPQVTRGYLHRPDKTAEAYEPCPFNEFRMYHTGDIVRYRQNGDVEFVGRKDGQVKIRGFRVETKEVETVIRGFAGIQDVTVQAYDHEGGGKYLAAFVVSSGTVDLAQLRAYIQEQKPAYMVPAAMMQIEKIPLTVNQKVDKKALPKPELQKAAYVAPEGKAEEDFCAIFGSVLGVEKVSAGDDFFELGGSSILAMKVVIAAGKAGYGIVYNDVFKYTTPRAMARFLGGAGRPETPGAAPASGAKASAAGPEASAAGPEASVALPETGRDGYDYSKIHALLAGNTLDAFRDGERLPLNDVLLLGGTGYLGSHVLHELITGYESALYCFVRPGKGASGETRLRDTLKHYFGADYAGLFGKRITVLEGDATDPEALSAFRAPSEAMTVINCAASVKHFARGGEIERANVDSVRNLAAWCEAHGARLVHISTGSVAGNRIGNLPPAHYRFDEHRLYAGQEIDSNQYIHSKFMAERHIYEEMLTHGLRAKVLRMGNLAPREADGKFQVNYTTNNYMNTFRAYQALGAIPYDALDATVEFSPIDVTARAVLALSETPEACICFTPLNNHRPRLGDVVRVLNEMGYPIRGVEDEAFAQALAQALADEARSEAVGSLIAYQSGDQTIQEIGLESIDNSYTTHILARLGFSWPETGAAYIRRFLEKLDQLRFFGGNNR